jgi:hypothetical protein
METKDEKPRHDSQHDVDESIVASAAAAAAILAASDALIPQLEARAAPIWPIGVTPPTITPTNNNHNGHATPAAATSALPSVPPLPSIAFNDTSSTAASNNNELVVVDLSCPSCNAALQVIDLGNVSHYRCPFCTKRFSM